MSSHSNTPWNKNIDFLLDIESTGLPGKHFLSKRYINGRYALPDIQDVREAFGSHVLLQFGYSKNDKVKHISVTETSTGFMPAEVTGHEVETVFQGQRVRATSSTVRRHSMEDISTFLKKSGALDNRQIQYYMENIAPVVSAGSIDTMFNIDLENGQNLYVSKWSKQKFLEKTEAQMADEVKGYGFKEGKTFFQQTMAAFGGKGEKESLYEILDDVLREAEGGAVKSIGAWNAPYDVNFIRYMLDQAGHTDLLRRFDSAVVDGSIMVNSIEKEWQLIAWKLVQENPDLAESFKIGYHPEAFVETGGRFGRVAQNFEEFQHSTLKWNTDALSRYLSWNKKIDSLSAAHHAGPDVNLEKAIFEQLEEIKAEAFRLANQAGLSYSSFEEFAKSKTDAKIMEQALQNVMGRHIKGNPIKKGTASSASMLKKIVAEDAKRAATFQAERFPSYMGAKLAENTAGKLKKFGGMAAALTVLLGSTYLFGKKETPTSEYGELKLGKKASLETDLYEQYTEKETEAHVSGQFFGKVVAGAIIPMAALYVIGFNSVKNSPSLLGVKGKVPSSLKETVTDIARTIYYGVRKTEANIPLTRLFRTQAMTEYFTGSSRIGLKVNSKGQSFYKGVHIPVTPRIRKGRVTNSLELNKIYGLLEAAKITNPAEAKIIEDFISPNNARARDVKAGLRISKDADSRVRIFFDEMTADGKVVAQKTKSVLLDLEGHVSSFRIENMLKKPITRSAAKYADEMGPIINPLLMHKFSEERVRQGLKKIDFNDYIAHKPMPQFVEGNASLEALWNRAQKIRFDLDLVAKGVGEGSSEIRPLLAEEIHHAQKMFVVTGFKGDKKWSKEGVSAVWNFWKHPAREFTYHSINTFLETPFELIGADKTIGDASAKLLSSKNQLANAAGKVLKFIQRPNLGLDTAGMRHGLPEYLAKFAYKRILPAFIGIEAIRATDHFLGWATMSPTGRGPLGTLATAAPHTASLIYSKMSDIFGLTNVAKRQEEVAPGSTGLGILAPGATLATMYKLGEVAHRYGSQGTRAVMDRGIEKFSRQPFVQRALRQEAWKGALRQEAWKGALRDRGPAERFFSWAIKNPKTALFGIGLLPTIPFWPGALGSNSSYKEKQAEYRGEKEVAIRKARGWLLSSSPFAGENVIQYRRSALNLFKSDFENRGVVWQNYRTRFLHNITAGLFGRYNLEEYHAKSQPVYQSAGYGEGIPLVGPLIASTIGRIIKPTRTYHLPSEGISVDPENAEAATFSGEAGGLTDYAQAYLNIGNNNAALTNQLSKGYIESGQIAKPGLNLQMSSETGVRQNIHQFKASFSEFAGFKGFFVSAIQAYSTGKKTPDEFVPYAESATQMYNPAQQMWAYSMGDISLVGGEFLRRIFQMPQKKWEVNNIPNEFFGQSWIPHDEEHGKDFWRGTTYDEVPMGWLYATRKGWEHLFPTMKDVALENYPDPIRLEILKGIAPQSPEFNVTSAKVGKLALANQLDPYQEQRYYNTLDQVREIKNKVYAHMQKYTFEVPTEAMSGKLTELNLDSSEFTVKTDDGLRKYRLAGISTNLADIRARLLKQQVFKTAEELDANARSIQENLHKIISEKMEIGDDISFSVAGEGAFSGVDKANEAIVGSLNNTLLKKGAPLADTGSLGTFNMAQKRAGLVARGMAKYWDLLTSQETFWDKKLISDRDYLGHYLTTQVFNREVKLWSRPIEHILKPALASTLRHFGVDKIPNFTTEKREKQQYWDVIKYIKYKMLANKSQQEGDTQRAHYYHTMWRRTMVGANPLDHNDRDEMLAMPASEKNYFRFFANEPDSKKRAKIFKYLPAAEKRIYEGIWTRELAKTSNDKDVQEAYSKLVDADGWKLNEREERQYEEETGGKISKGDWARARFVSKFAENNVIPGLEWEGWASDVDIENVEIEALRQQGEQTEDYGFFENKARQAAFDSPAFQAALDINSLSNTSSDVIGTIVPFIAGSDSVPDAYSMPTTSNNPIVSTNVKTNGYMKSIERNMDPSSSLIHEDFYSPRSHLNGW